MAAGSRRVGDGEARPLELAGGGSLVLTSLSALLPIAALYERREGMRGLKWNRPQPVVVSESTRSVSRH